VNHRPDPVLRADRRTAASHAPRAPRATHAPWRAIALGLLLAAGQAGAADPTASRLYEDALQRFNQGDYKGSTIQLKNALQRDRTLLPVHLLLGRALLEGGQPAAAEVALNEALRLGVSRAEAVVPLAQSLVEQGKQPLLLSDSRFSPTGLPPATLYRLQLLRSSAAADLGDAAEALRIAQQARLLQPKDPDACLAEVALHVRARRFDDALAAAEQALALAPQAAGPQYQRAQIEHVRGDLRAALEGYGRALARDPGHVDALVSRAGLLVDLGRLDEAGRDVATLRRAVPKDPRAAFLAALLAERQGRPGEQREALKEVTGLIDPVPKDFVRYRAQVLMLGGLAHYGLGEREAAKPYLEAYQKLDPGGGVAKLLARIQLAEGNVEPATQTLEAYLRVHGDDSQARALMAAALSAQGRHGKAAQMARQALEQRDDPALRVALGMSLLGDGEVADAIAELEAAYRQDPGQQGAAATLVALYLQRGQAAKGLALAQSLAQRQPASARMQALLGQARLGNGDAAGARQALERAVAMDPSLQSAQVQLSRLDAAQGHFDAAEQRLTSLLSKDERNEALLFELAALMQRKGQPLDAQRWLERAVTHADSRDYRSSLALADLHLRQGRPADALAVTKSMAAKLPTQPRPQIAVARMALANQDPQTARIALGAATRLADYDAPLQLEIALLQLAAGNLDGAAYSLDKSLSNRPDFVPALATQVDVEIRRGAPDAALQAAQRVQQLVPSRSIGHTLLGDVAWAQGHREPAVEHYRRAHKAEPDTRTATRLASALEASGQAAAAVEVLRGWVQARADDLEAGRALAGLLARRGDLKAARQVYERLAARWPNDAPVLNDLANVLLVLEPRAAVAMAERALAAAPGDAGVIDTLGWVCFRNGQTDRALQLLRDARLRRPDDPTIRYHLAEVLAAAGRAGEARAELQGALAGPAPRFEGAEDARKLLQSLP